MNICFFKVKSCIFVRNNKNDMPEQITPLSVLYLLLHGAGTAVCVVLFLYLLLCRGKAIAPDITPPARLRRWISRTVPLFFLSMSLAF